MPTVSFNDKKQVVEAEKGSTILDALFDAKVDYPHGCLAGSCGLCAIVVHNEDSLEEAREIEKHTLSTFNNSKLRLACRAMIKDNVQVSEFKEK